MQFQENADVRLYLTQVILIKLRKRYHVLKNL